MNRISVVSDSALHATFALPVATAAAAPAAHRAAPSAAAAAAAAVNFNVGNGGHG